MDPESKSNGQSCDQSPPHSPASTTNNSPNLSHQPASQPAEWNTLNATSCSYKSKNNRPVLPYSVVKSDNQSTRHRSRGVTLPSTIHNNSQQPARKPVQSKDVTTLNATQSYNQSTPHHSSDVTSTTYNLPNISQLPAIKPLELNAVTTLNTTKHLILPEVNGQSYNQQSTPPHTNLPFTTSNVSQPPARHTAVFNDALRYLLKVKDRFRNQSDMYEQFLKICLAYHKQPSDIKGKVESILLVYVEIAELLHNQEDLLREFAQFLPDDAAYALGLQQVKDEGNSEAKRK